MSWCSSEANLLSGAQNRHRHICIYKCMYIYVYIYIYGYVYLVPLPNLGYWEHQSNFSRELVKTRIVVLGTKYLVLGTSF
jgi:hypothetical protein